MSGTFYPNRYQYNVVAPSATGTPLAATTGAKGDYLRNLICSITTSATSQVTLLDGATSIVVVPASSPVGVITIPIEAASANGAWTVTTAAGVQVIGVGIFSP